MRMLLILLLDVLDIACYHYFYNKTPTSMTSLLNYLPCNLSLLGPSIMIVMMIFVTNRRFAMPKLIYHYKITTVIL